MLTIEERDKKIYHEIGFHYWKKASRRYQYVKFYIKYDYTVLISIGAICYNS